MAPLRKAIRVGDHLAEPANTNIEAGKLAALLEASKRREAELTRQLAEQRLKSAPRGEVADMSLLEIADKYSLGELADEFDVTADIPNAPEIIEGVIPLPGVGLLAGMSGTGKTAIMLDIVAHLVRGDVWNGRRVTGKQGVLWYGYESVNSIKYRWKAIAKEVGSVMHHVPFYPVLSNPSRLDAKSGYAVMFGAVRHHQERCREEHGCELTVLVIDTATASGLVTNDSDQEQWNKAWPLLMEISSSLGITIAVLHHSAKGEEGSIVRGSGVSYDHADFIIGLKAENVEGERGRRYMFLEKHRDEETGYLTDYSMRSVAVGLKASGDTRFAPVVVYSGQPKKVDPFSTVEKSLRLAISRVVYSSGRQPEKNDDDLWIYRASMNMAEAEFKTMVPPKNAGRDLMRAKSKLTERGVLKEDGRSMVYELTSIGEISPPKNQSQDE
ncbi:AAA family ATPase [Rhizobium rhizogenes]|uniref:Uncharacterized protein n=1 Tax=Rhizobium rhizogenes NBRC 13257 TaxID=1220581 RepID=A0AA87U799_RHIRH|nr:AAA family ATPase [Rhizobium rhizogenes]NTG60420.1 AAA family ATPase [Rhizobium rhizogenes]NTG66970.1 AAA family ATPase [Rhizobium rhizogenes]NTG79942.1 AAA family ATPase [Rhizobium rhizogenes]NTH95623.1 AAA family ATPase [Rhizobium rhizogenes]NTI67834.1 AAA family ATPase [Rhizobium rhizogenes]